MNKLNSDEELDEYAREQTEEIGDVLVWAIVFVLFFTFLFMLIH